VIEEVNAWHGRPLDKLFFIVGFDALMAKVRDECGLIPP